VKHLWWKLVSLFSPPANPDRPRPKLLSLEATNRCNLNCPFCLVGLQNSLDSTAHSEMPRPFGKMDVALYEKILKDARDFGIESVQLHFQGEPLLHNKLIDMVRIAHEGGFEVRLFTNGMLMDEARAGGLIEAGVDSIRFSVDGATPETYAVNRVGGDFDVVFGNMRRTVELCRESGRTVRVIWQFIAMRNTEDEIPQAERMAREIGAELAVKRLAVSMPELVPRNPKYRRRMNIKPCRDPYNAVFVYWNGDVVICCYDQEGENVIGNAAKNTLAEIWGGRKARLLRRRIDQAVQHPEREPAMCRACLLWSHSPWQTSDGLTKWDPAEEAACEDED